MLKPYYSSESGDVVLYSCRASDLPFPSDVSLLFTQPYDVALITPYIKSGKVAILQDRPGRKLTDVLPDLQNIGLMYANQAEQKEQHLYQSGCTVDLDLSKYSCVAPCFWEVAFCVDVIEQTTKRGDLVFDPFMGRGTVGKAARMLGRRFIGVDKRGDRVAMAKELICS